MNKNNLLPTNEFASNPANYRFAIDPLDMGLAKMQKGLKDALTNDIPETGRFESVRFTFTSKNPMRLIGDIHLSCECGDDDCLRRILLTICAKEQTAKREVVLIEDTHQSVLAFAADCGCNGLFAHSKIHTLWYDELLRERT